MKSFLFLLFFLISVGGLHAASRPEPQAQIDAFFKDLGEKGSAAAMKELCDGTLLESQKGVQLETYASQVETALKLYGKVARVEIVDKKLYGESFVRHRLITYHASGAPLFWEFMFFRVNDEWQIYVFRFNDQFNKVFSDTP